MELERIARKISKTFDEYELFGLRESGKKYETREGVIHGIEIKEEQGVAMRAIKDGKVVFSYTYELEDRAASMLLENATALVPFVDTDREVSFPGPCDGYHAVDCLDEKGLSVDGADKVRILAEMEKNILAFDHRIKKTRNCELNEDLIEAWIVNSKGLSVSGRKSLFSVSALCVAESGDEVSYYDWSWAHRYDDLDPVGMGLNVARNTIKYLSGSQIATGIYNGILTPRAACDMLDILGGSFLSENLFKNKTRLKDRTGDKVFAEQVTISDSGLAGMDAFPFDGEGVASRRTDVVCKGLFQGFLYDTYYGNKFGLPSTGNSRRSGLKEPPRCGHRGLLIEPGPEDLYGGFSDGIVIDELMGAHTANEITGDFSLGAIGFLRKNGEDIPFKGVIFSGNVFEIFSSVRGVGSDMKFYGTVGAPSLAVENLKISGT